ncbi:MAG: CinA family nicotinamide mononucleotide deamidase-related protein [Candidatus Competibacterales bacterium]
MRVEIIAVGTELLLGQHVDTNSAWMGEQLALAGINSHFQCKVGDNHQRIKSAIEIALARSEGVILCGGLGPTPDDITREAIAAVMGTELVQDDAIAQRIEQRFRERNRPMPPSNLRQALVPVGARVLSAMPGTAPGLMCPVGDKVIYAVPGVPAEMKVMVGEDIIPDLQRRAGGRAVIQSRVLRTWGESESGLAERLAERIAFWDRERGGVTLAFLASGVEGIKVRITAKATDGAQAKALIDAEEAEIRTILGDLVFGVDDQSMEVAVLGALAARRWTLGVAEAVTGGLMTARLTAAALSSEAETAFRGGITACHRDLRAELFTSVEPLESPAAAEALAQGARRWLGSDLGLAATGVTEEGGNHGLRPGTAFLAVADASGTTAATVHLPGRRSMVRELTVISALNLLRLQKLNT